MTYTGIGGMNIAKIYKSRSELALSISTRRRHTRQADLQVGILISVGIEVIYSTELYICSVCFHCAALVDTVVHRICTGCVKGQHSKR